MSLASARMPSSVLISLRIGPVLSSARIFVASAVLNAALSGGSDAVSGSICQVDDQSSATDGFTHHQSLRRL